jgi:membrane-associated phospholipid phosphatase
MTHSLVGTLPRARAVGLMAAATGALLLAGVGLLVGDPPPRMDSWGVDTLRLNPGGDAERLVAAFSDGLRAASVAAAAAAVGWMVWRERRAAAGQALGHISMFLVLVASSEFLKAIVARPHPVDPADVSFPSTHVAMVTVGALIAVALAGRFAVRWRGWMIVAAVLAILATAASRVWLGEHYLTDVLASGVGYAGLTSLGLSLLGTWRRPVQRTS